MLSTFANFWLYVRTPCKCIFTIAVESEQKETKCYETRKVNKKKQSAMRHLAVLLVFSLKFTHVKMKEPNKLIQPQKTVTQVKNKDS